MSERSIYIKELLYSTDTQIGKISDPSHQDFTIPENVWVAIQSIPETPSVALVNDGDTDGVVALRKDRALVKISDTEYEFAVGNIQQVIAYGFSDTYLPKLIIGGTIYTYVQSKWILDGFTHKLLLKTTEWGDISSATLTYYEYIGPTAIDALISTDMIFSYNSGTLARNPSASNYTTDANVDLGYNNNLTGTYLFSSGDGNVLSSNHSYAFGTNIVTNSSYSMGIGSGITISSPNCFAFGNTINIQSLSQKSYCIGTNLSNSSSDSLLIGKTITNTSFGNFLIGELLSIQSHNTIVIGYNTTISDASYSNIIAFGSSNSATGSSCFAAGSHNVVARNAVAIGYNSYAKSIGAIALGVNNSSEGIYSTSIGNGNAATAANSSAFGYGNSNWGEFATAMGNTNTITASGANSFVAGQGCICSGDASIALGKNCTASGSYSLSTGYSNISSGINSITMGEGNTSSGNYSIAAGRNNNISGGHSIAVGLSNIVSGLYSIAMGRSNTSSGPYSIALGYTNNATGEYSFVTGRQCTSSGIGTFAFGRNCISSGTQSFSGGVNCVSSGARSIAYGNNCAASVPDSYAFGSYSSCNQVYSIVHGRFLSLTVPSVLTGAHQIVYSYLDTDWVKIDFENGNVDVSGAYLVNGADYAEMFESASGAKLEVGRFVSVKSGTNKIEYGNQNIIGITSATYSMMANAYHSEWHDKYLKTDFGEKIYETQNTEIIDDDGNKNKIKIDMPKLNPKYDSSLKYQSRIDRPEWSSVGLLGQLIVCAADNKIAVSDRVVSDSQGYAIKSTDGTGYLVLEIIKKNIIKILFK